MNAKPFAIAIIASVSRRRYNVGANLLPTIKYHYMDVVIVNIDELGQNKYDESG